jgi:hypothetical protein
MPPMMAAAMQAATIQRAGWRLLAGSVAADARAALPPAFFSGFATLATPVLCLLFWRCRFALFR